MYGTTFASEGQIRQRSQISRALREAFDDEAAEVFNQDLSCPFLYFPAIDRFGNQIIVIYPRSWVDRPRNHSDRRKEKRHV